MLARLTGALVLLVSLGLPAASPAAAPQDQPRVTIAMLPSSTTVEELSAAVPDAATAVLSAGIGIVPASQTYLDIGQGARLASSLYPEFVPPLYVTGNRVSALRWREVRDRAADAPADIEPGLLASELKSAGVPIAARPLAGSPALIAVDEYGRVRRTSQCESGECTGVSVTSVTLAELPGLAARATERPDDLLIALERPPADRELLAVGIAGAGFSGGGTLTSQSTRMDGYVLSTDVLPTILAIYGLPVPDAVSGRAIETTGSGDAAEVADRELRLSEVDERRAPVLGFNLVAWVVLGLVATLIGGRAAARAVLVLLPTAMASIPALLLLAVALDASELTERLLVGIGAPLAAGLLLVACRRLGDRAPFAAFAVAAAVSVLAVAIDVIAGSPLTALSLLGPNPGFGVRFYGIGNELEATIAALLLLGCGAAVTALAPRDPARAVAIVVAVCVLAAVLVFAPGRFGADVGAAITFPAGAAGAIIAALRLRRSRALLVVAAPVLALLGLIGIDLALGGDAHLSRSVLEAGGLDEVGDVLERRIRLGAGSFPNYIDSPFFILSLVAIVTAVAFRRRIASWFAERPAAAAGTVGAISATVVGTLANDSAALLLMVGTGFVAAYCGLAWATARETDPAPR
jgi:hypothetical protein